MKNKKIHLLLQARVGSRRLPKKSLRFIQNLTLIELCIKRAFSKKYNCCVLIPKRSDNNQLEKIIKKLKVKCFRGSHKNVYLRFFNYLKKTNDNEIIIRLTADNPFVDIKFIDYCLKIFKKKKMKYFSSHQNIKNIPYGLSVEIFYYKYFKEFKKNLSKETKEHVTFDLAKKYKNKELVISLFKNKIKKNLKISIDTIEDEIFVKEIFGKKLFKPYYFYLKKLFKQSMS